MAEQDEIIAKLMVLFVKPEEHEDLVRIMHYLTEENNAYGNNGNIALVWRTLKSAMRSDAVFKTYAKLLAEDTKSAKNDPRFWKAMAEIWQEMITSGNANEMDGGWRLTIASFDPNMTTGALAGLARAWPLIPVSNRTQISQILPRIISVRSVLSSIQEVIDLVDQVGGPMVIVALAAATLTSTAIHNIYLWKIGKCSGKRCAINIVDSIVSVSISIGGGIAGVAVGSLTGPIGVVVGGVVAGLLSGVAASALCDRLVRRFFKLPKEEATENAYNFLRVNMKASNGDVNAAFRKLGLKYPDKGGLAEDFHTLQVCMQLIRLSRGEDFFSGTKLDKNRSAISE